MLDPAEAVSRLTRVYGGPHAARTLHAKGAFYEGTFTATPEAAALTTARFLQGEPVPVLVRWSNGGGHPRASDERPDVRGMAVSFRPPGEGAADLLGQTAPRFPVRTPEAFVAMTEALNRPVRLPMFLLRHPDVLPRLVQIARSGAAGTASSYAEVGYYPIHAYAWADAAGRRSWVRYRFVPLPSDPPAGSFSGKDRLREEIAARLAAGPVRFDLRVTVAAPGDDPHDPTSVWTGARELSAGVITVTAPVADPEAGGGVVVFDPTRVVPGIELSDDPILRYRPRAYSVSADRRAGP